MQLLAMGNPLRKSPRKITVAVWLIIAVSLGVNFWMNYYHPIGWLLDVIILVVLIGRLYPSDSKR